MDYVKPLTALEALQAGQGKGACYLAGGTDLILQWRRQQIEPRTLVDLGGVQELKTFGREGRCVVIGSMVTFSELLRSDLVREEATALWLACQTMGSPAIRNQATLGGNLGNCSPAADALPALLALGAQVSLMSESGLETVDLAELLQRQPVLFPGTLIRDFRLPLNGWRSGFAKLGRRSALAIARISVAVSVKLDGQFVSAIRIALGAVGPRAFLAQDLADVLNNREINGEWFELAITGAQNVVREALGDRASAPYKRVAVGGVMREALAFLKAEGEVP